jgi:hypothetical protein
VSALNPEYGISLFQTACAMANQSRPAPEGEVFVEATDAEFAVYLKSRYPHYFSLSLPGLNPLTSAAAVASYPAEFLDRLEASVRTLRDESARAALLIQIMDLHLKQLSKQPARAQ